MFSTPRIQAYLQLVQPGFTSVLPSLYPMPLLVGAVMGQMLASISAHVCKKLYSQVENTDKA
jgi:hypothetical protein